MYEPYEYNHRAIEHKKYITHNFYKAKGQQYNLTNNIMHISKLKKLKLFNIQEPD